MRNLFLATLLLSLLYSCENNNELQIPNDILSKNKIVAILIDMHIADATLISFQLDKKETKYRGENYYEMVLNKHNVSRKQFDKAIIFYARYPDYYEKIYDDVLAELNLRTGELSKNDSTITVD